MHSEELKRLALSLDADCVGVASREAYERIEPNAKLDVMVAGAKSLVIFGIWTGAGAIESPSTVVQSQHLMIIYDELNRIGLKLARDLERAGHRTSTIPPHLPIEMSKETKGLMGPVSLRHAAEAAGLGKLGLNRLLINPQFGARLRLGGLVTDAKLAPDPILSESLCDNCMECVKACPVSAIGEDGKVDVIACTRNNFPYGLSNLIKRLADLAMEGSPEDWKKFIKNPEFWNYYQALSLGLFYCCFECQRACPVALQKQ
ncbi:MAG: epoxyqueuosine reductase [Candidatus Abyssobacteria bacterium SURF_17]|uniref:Epoxyqueuosine reductase n=1 Tax=Candidatus Abyssobacteria bacterium SURF_17 TaxID=2093361 RepID=A0A419ESZ5_9BACT|nr:MAG: epoxyqueuosine reductase [Candidatus Abyssubacteria bacterium SURF_17]